MKKEYDLSRLKAVKNPYANKKKSSGIILSPEIIDYFKGLAARSRIPYPTLIQLYLLDCVRSKRKLKFEWAA